MDNPDPYSPTDCVKDHVRNDHTHSSGRQSHKRCAKEAAQCGGKFWDLVDPLERFGGFESDSNKYYMDQPTDLRFFFKGNYAASSTMNVKQPKEVFLKF